MWYIGSVLWRKPDKIFKKGIASLKGVKIGAFPIKTLEFKIFVVSFPKFEVFAKISKIMFYHFCWFLASAISKFHSDLFIFDNVIHILLKVPSIRISLSMGSLNGKTCLS